MSEKPGTWPQVCVQRAFVEGASWWQFRVGGFTAFPSEREQMETEAVNRYGEPTLRGIVAAAEERGRRSVFADPEALARRFHETYERLAPEYGYETRKESAVPWEKVPEKNRRLMIAVCAALAPRDSGKED